jgi:predicted nucleic acid-binding protein
VKYLIDTSALVRILRRQVDQSWHQQVAHGMVAICDPVLTETLTIARATAYERVRTDLLEAYPRVPVPDRAWETVHSVQAQLAAKSQHTGLSVADHLVVATALHHRLTILHEDADFGTAAASVPDLKEQRILAGDTGTQDAASRRLELGDEAGRDLEVRVGVQGGHRGGVVGGANRGELVEQLVVVRAGLALVGGPCQASPPVRNCPGRRASG